VGSETAFDAYCYDNESDIVILTVNFGDGNTDTIPCPADRASTGISHIYYSTGQYQVTAYAVDEHGAVSNEVALWILIHDPFIKGKGNISTIRGGRFLDEAEHFIDAKFEFAAKYKQCVIPNVPTGYISFEFDDGTAFIFESQTLEWLIFDTDDEIKKAMFKGYGTVNGEGSYYFIAALQDTGKPSKSLKSSQETVTDTFGSRLPMMRTIQLCKTTCLEWGRVSSMAPKLLKAM